MRKLIIALVLSATGIVPLPGNAQQIADNAPTAYTVVRGDTLWGIAGKFLKEPWRWPEIWNMNREEVKNPHWIYPGDVIKLEVSADGNPRLVLDGEASLGGTVKLSPRIRSEALSQAIPSIPGAAIGPFLTLPLVVEEKGLENSPKIVATEEGRVIVGAGNSAYVDYIDPTLGTKWQIYRQGRALTDSDTKSVLGFEAIYIGDARVTRFGQPSTIEVVRSVQEINRGDRLTPSRETAIPSYSPHAPEQKIQGKIISINQGVAETSQFAIVVINRGKSDGLEVGHVLAAYRAGETVNISEKTGLSFFDKDVTPNPVVADPIITGIPSVKNANSIKLPDERNGLVFVFRVFDKLSYALVMHARRPIRLYDVVQTP